jgi:hypothetical protein
MWIITLRGKPATMEQLNLEEHKYYNGVNVEECYDNLIACRTRRGCIETYLHFWGFKWAERPKSVSVTRIKL